MNSTTTPDLKMMAKAYFSDKIAIALGSQFMGYVLSFSFLPLSIFSLSPISESSSSTPLGYLLQVMIVKY
jgi:hypothetical protein